MNEELIKDFNGRILARIETDSHGNKTVRSFRHWVLGYYKADLDVTTDFYGKIIARGDATGMLIPTEPD